MMASAQGGVDIEEVAARDPDAILKVRNPSGRRLPALPGATARLRLGLGKDQVARAVDLMKGLHAAFVACDASLVEVNPFLRTRAGDLFGPRRQGQPRRQRPCSATPTSRSCATSTRRRRSRSRPPSSTSNYIKLEGARWAAWSTAPGLAMATMDIIKLAGGSPANFLDVGGGANAEQIRNAFRICSPTTTCGRC